MPKSCGELENTDSLDLTFQVPEDGQDELKHLHFSEAPQGIPMLVCVGDPPLYMTPSGNKRFHIHELP